jgi:aryl-alcohol dehydrogenase-like predicted oxidoreductase
MEKPFGRTNVPVPSVWYQLLVPRQTEEGWIAPMVDAAVETGAPLDVTDGAPLWGSRLRGTGASVVVRGGLELERATEEKAASEQISAHLIQMLSALGTEKIDFYYLRVRRALEESVLNGAMEALESAREDGLVRFFGLSAEGSAMAALGLWQFHDAFESVMVPRNPLDFEAYDTLKDLAQKRRVGLVTRKPLQWAEGEFALELPGAEKQLNDLQNLLASYAAEHSVLVGVRSAQEVRWAQQATEKTPESDPALALKPLIDHVTTTG